MEKVQEGLEGSQQGKDVERGLWRDKGRTDFEEPHKLCSILNIDEREIDVSPVFIHALI